MHKTDLVVALDYTSLEKAEDLISQLEGLPVIYKIGIELFMASGPDWVKMLSQSGEHVFLDLKFHDIPGTVGQAVLKAAELSPDFLTLHLTGGNAMLDEVQTRLREAQNANALMKKPKIIGVPVLSSFDNEDWKKTAANLARTARSIEEVVLQFSNLADTHQGVDGMICSPHELAAIRVKHPDLFLMVAGIRPKGVFKYDQNWVMTPSEAKKAGASAIVVGRPIQLADDSRAMTERILEELDKAA